MRHLHDDICHRNTLMGRFSDAILFLYIDVSIKKENKTWI